VVVLFRCDAGKEDGLGHVMRCLTLADALRERGDTVTFCTRTGPDMVGQVRISARGFPCIEIAEAAGSAGDVKALVKLERDVLVVDSRRSTPRYIKALAGQGFVVVVDDDGMPRLEADVVINASMEGEGDRYPDRHNRSFDLIGPKYNLIDPSLFVSRPFAAEARRLLVTFGGEDPHNHTSWVLDRFASAFAGLEVTVAIGPAHPDADSVRLAAKKVGATVLERPPSLTPYILDADVAITAGGTTCYELAAAGVPMLVIGVEPHQKQLIDAFVERGACWPLGMGHDVDIASGCEALRNLIGNRAARMQMHGLQKAMFPEPGVGLVADSIRAAWARRSGQAR
jgi:UDP-2,4-diacetamido-2,4,6-trideoxy-beta-L-altropyranose hydrolase